MNRPSREQGIDNIFRQNPRGFSSRMPRRHVREEVVRKTHDYGVGP
ncbi:MAG: hypothetical protein ABR915_21840 [Thermoguttaceae bacterium]